MMRPLFHLLAIAVATAALSAQTTSVHHMTWDGLERSYVVHIPATDSARALPLVIALHGRGGSARGMLRATALDAKANSARFVLVAPEGTGDPRGWYTGFSSGAEIDDVGFIGAIIDTMLARYPIDRARVYVTGHSNGAVLAHRVAADLAPRIAAAAVVAGAVGARGPDGIVRRIEFPRAPVPILIIHGDADPIVPYDTVAGARARPVPAPEGARFWARANECAVLAPRKDSLANGRADRDVWAGRCRAPVELVTIRNGGHAWPRTARGDALDATDLLWDFFARHRR